MKKCAFCAEEIQDEAIKCKHCGSDLSSQTPAPNSNSTETTKASALNKEVKTSSALKWIGVSILVIVGLIFWYITIPALVIWYLYKKDKKLSSKAKLVTSIVTVLIFLPLGALHLHEGRAPELQITSPGNGYSVQASSTTITGIVDPVDAYLNVNGAAVTTDENGNFTYNAPLRSETNKFTFVAENNDKEARSNITIERIFTEEEIAERESQAEQARIEKEEKRIAEAKEKLQREIDSIAEGIDETTYRGDVLALQLEIALFAAWADIINEYKDDENAEVQTLANQLEDKAIAFQVREFPKIRQNYAEVAAELMWESNIEVESLGGTHKTLQLTGGLFANNANKAEAQRTINEMVEMLRFNQVNYKWYEYDDEYTYYELDTPADSELVVLEE